MVNSENHLTNYIPCQLNDLLQKKNVFIWFVTHFTQFLALLTNIEVFLNMTLPIWLGRHHQIIEVVYIIHNLNQSVWFALTLISPTSQVHKNEIFPPAVIGLKWHNFLTHGHHFPLKQPCIPDIWWIHEFTPGHWNIRQYMPNVF